MAYFQCNHGELYFPFGKGGKEQLELRLKGLQLTNAVSSRSSKAMERLLQCPLHSLPLSENMSREDLAITSATQGTGHGPVTLPVVLSQPQSEPAITFGRLAEDIVVELLKMHMEASQVTVLSSYQLRL
jgi:hypothetical protein